MRLIDIDAMGIGIADPDVFVNAAYADGWNNVIKIIKLAPTVDAVPVVRCRDCRHMSIEQGLRYCDAWERFNGEGDDGFCNYGERISNAEEQRHIPHLSHS